MTPSLRDKYVTLHRAPVETNDADGYYEALTPPDAWIAIDPLSPGNEGRSTQSYVTMDYHPQLTVDVQITYEDSAAGRTRYLYVRGIQDLNEKHATMRVLVDEAGPS